MLKCNSTFKIKKDMCYSSMSPFIGNLDYNCTQQTKIIPFKGNFGGGGACLFREIPISPGSE